MDASPPALPPQPTAYTVFVDDNFHYQDEDERYQLGTYPTYEEALEVCRKMVSSELEEHYQSGMTADQLYQHYTSFGSDPWIKPAPSHLALFSAWNYARERADAICSNTGS